MGKSKGKRAARLRQTKKRRDAKRLARKREIVSGEERNAERIVSPPDPPSPIATEVVHYAKDSTDSVKGNTDRESSVLEEQSGSVCKDRECTDCQRLRTLLYEEQRKPRVFHTECVQCQKRREAKIMEAKQSLHYRMYSGESAGSRYFLAALATKKKRSTTDKYV